MDPKFSRPRRIKSDTFKVETGCGSMYVIVGKIPGGETPIEVFASLGKAGGCSTAQNEALGRAISLGLKYGIPAEEFIGELRGVRCPNPKIGPKNSRCLSCAEGIGMALSEFLGVPFYDALQDGLISNEDRNSD